MRHPTPRQLSGALLGALAVMSLQGCKRIEMATPKVPAKPSPTAYVDDSVLTARVRAALLRSPVVNSFNIGIETHEGVVLLSGMAVNTTQIDLAVFVAQTVPGVNSVDSFMFSSGLAAAETTEKAYSVDPGGLTATRPPGQIPPVERSGRGGQPSNTPTPVISVSHPLSADNSVTPEKAHRPSRWVGMAHRVLGIRSIQDELLIKP